MREADDGVFGRKLQPVSADWLQFKTLSIDFWEQLGDPGDPAVKPVRSVSTAVPPPHNTAGTMSRTDRRRRAGQSRHVPVWGPSRPAGQVLVAEAGRGDGARSSIVTEQNFKNSHVTFATVRCNLASSRRCRCLFCWTLFHHLKEVNCPSTPIAGLATQKDVSVHTDRQTEEGNKKVENKEAST